MATIRVKTPNLVGGVSQQPDEIKIEGQVRDLENAYLSAIEGMTKRLPTEHLNRVLPFALRDVKTHGINRDSFEQYLLLLSHDSLIVQTPDGTSVPVYSFTNLLLSPNEFFYSDSLDPFLADWIPEFVDVVANFGEDPEHNKTADIIVDRDIVEAGFLFQRLVQGVEATFVHQQEYTWSIHFKNGQPDTDDYVIVPDQPCSFKITEQGPGGGPVGATLADVVVVPETGAIVSSSGTRIAVTDEGNGWYKVQGAFTYDATGVPDIQFEIYPTDPADGTQQGSILVWNAEILDTTRDLSYLDVENDQTLPLEPHTFLDDTVRNHQVNSNDFDESNWIQTENGLVANLSGGNPIPDPTGGLSGWELTDNDFPALFGINDVLSVLDGHNYCFSLWMQDPSAYGSAVTVSRLRLGGNGVQSTTALITWNGPGVAPTVTLQSSIGTGVHDVGIDQIADGDWYRIFVNMHNIDSLTGGTIADEIQPCFTPTTGQLRIYGAQVDRGSTPSTYQDQGGVLLGPGGPWQLNQSTTDSAIVTGVQGPFGLSTWSVLRCRANETFVALYSQPVGTIFDGAQIFSCYVSRDSLTRPSDFFSLNIFDVEADMSMRADFRWREEDDCWEVVKITDGAFDAGCINLGSGVFQLWVGASPFRSNGSVAGNTRFVFAYVGDINQTFSDGVPEQSLLAWGARIENGTSKPTPWYSPREYLSVQTVADFSFIANQQIKPQMLPDLSPQPVDYDEAHVFVRQGDFNLTYKILVVSSGTSTPAEVTTWDGVENTGEDTGKATWLLEIVDKGTNNTDWIVDITHSLGQDPDQVTVSSGGGTFTENDLAAALASAINALPDVAATTEPVDSLVISSVQVNDAIVVSVAEAGGPGNTGTHNLTQTGFVGDPLLLSIQTDEIARALDAQLALNPNIETLAFGSVIRIRTPKKMDVLEVTDGNANQNMVRMYEEVEFVEDLPTKCTGGTVLKIGGVTGVIEDDYYVKFKTTPDEREGIFGEGLWEESLQPGITFEIDQETMPHALIRRQDTDAGTLTGEPGSIYFQFDPFDWKDRLVGDTESSPVPSFIDQSIREIFFFKNRLGLLADSNVIQSEVGVFGNFWRTTVQTLVDSDVIDITVGHERVSRLQSGSAFGGGMLVFSDRTLFNYGDQDLLSPKTAAIAPLLEYENIPEVDPLVLGRSVIFSYAQKDSSGVRELVELQDNIFDATDITASLPSYITGRMLDMTASTLMNLGVFLSEDRQSLYMYNFFWAGNQKVQSAWSRWTFNGGYVLGMEFLDNDLFLYVERHGELHLEVVKLGELVTDTRSEYTMHLDRRLTEDAPGVFVSYDAGLNQTTYTLPLSVDDDTWTVITRNQNEVIAGYELDVVSKSGSDLVVNGDTRELNLFIGLKYPMRVELPRPYLRETEQQGGRGFVPSGGDMKSGRFQVKHALVSYANAAEFDVDVKRQGRAVTTRSTRRGEYSSNLGISLRDGVLRVPVNSKSDGLFLTLRNDTPFPSRFLSVEFVGQWSPQAQLFRA